MYRTTKVMMVAVTKKNYVRKRWWSRLSVFFSLLSLDLSFLLDNAL